MDEDLRKHPIELDWNDERKMICIFAKIEEGMSFYLNQ